MCEYGIRVDIVQRLIDLGARLNTIEQNKVNKSSMVALHWAINNQLTLFDRSSDSTIEVLKCLLDNHARIGIAYYQDITPLEYAEKYNFTAASSLIKKYQKKDDAYIRGATIGLFRIKLASDRDSRVSISQFLTLRDGVFVAQTNKHAYKTAKESELSTQKKI